jgi:anaerobic dimethyl sulfoxide reductase subunit B (iron-sulfur subunit)
MQIGFYFNQTKCIGCYTCVVACKDWYDIPAGPASWRWIVTIEKGKYPDPFVAFLSLSCLHCNSPSCIQSCPVNAITKREEDGIVMVDKQTCLGNVECALFCSNACPYNAPQFGTEDDAKMQMCNLCVDRLADGKKPICVEACIMRALDAGPIDKLRAEYGDFREAEGFIYSTEVNPSIIIKPRVRNT